jgi:hypothetical protein
MEEVGENFVFYLSISSSDGWIDKGRKHEIVRFAKKLSH